MDVVTISRWQFAITAMFHFLFVPLTLGLSILVAWFETQYVRTKDDTWLRLTKFWGKLFLINFALGVVTGITMEFQFGMNWAEYSRYMGDIFGAPLAIEATVAFFLESVFIGVWIFGWNKVSPKMHATAMWLVALATNMSALWILLANGWMQNPVGYRLAVDALGRTRAEMTDFGALLTNTYSLLKFFHTVSSGYTVAAFFVMGIAAWHLLRGQERDVFTRSFRTAAIFGLVSTLVVAMTGDFHAAEIAKVQPTKLAAMEALWETERGAPMILLQVPDEERERNRVALFAIPKMISYLAFRDGESEVKGLKAFPKDLRPPVLPVFGSFRLMVGIGIAMILLTLWGVYVSRRAGFMERRRFLRLMLWALPLPYIAGQLGWIVAEVGRQPWIVYGILKTSNAVSPAVGVSQVIMSLLGFTLLYGTLAVVDLWLLAKYARRGPA